MALIELAGVTRSYRVGRGELKALKGIDLTIEAGEFVAVMGPSGSGKSTLLQILGLLDRPTSGSYRLLGRDVSRLSDDEGAILRSRTIGFVFQLFNLLTRTSAVDNVALPLIYAGATDRDRRSRQALARMGLEDWAEHRPNEMSGGQQQRVAIARSLVNRPRIIFADEPTGNVASDQAEEILALLKGLNETGITLILVTHDEDVAAHARRVIRLKDGVIVSDARRPAGKAGASAAAARAEENFDLVHPRLSLAEFGEYGASALRAMAANKLRSALSMLGIMIGVGAVIAMLAVGHGAQKAVEARIKSLGSNLVMLIPGATSVGGVRGGAGSRSRLRSADVKAISDIPHVLRAEGNVRGSGQVVYEDNNWSTSVYGAGPLYAEMHAAQPYYGRFFTEDEDARMERVAVIGDTVVDNLFPDENPVGKIMKINQIDFKVVGLLPVKGSQGFNDQDDVVVIPLHTAMKRVLGKAYMDSIYVEADSPDSVPAVISDTERLMRRRHHLPDFKDDDFNLRNMSEIQAALSGTTQTFTLLLGIVAAISLLVGGIGIMNIMLVSVTERTREIGLRKAVGAARRAILTQFLMEAAALSTLGGIIGILLGVGVSLGLSAFAGWAAVVTPSSVGLAFAFSACVGVVFGFWPARRASLLSPIEALRYE
jgi:macrolide transport system ATP-binding/permease protein